MTRTSVTFPPVYGTQVRKRVNDVIRNSIRATKEAVAGKIFFLATAIFAIMEFSVKL